MRLTPPLVSRCANLFLGFFIATLFFFLYLQEFNANKIIAEPLNAKLFETTVSESINEETPSRKVVIGAVSCRNLTEPDTMKYSKATVVMLKSVLISAKLYQISEVELHLFLEHQKDEHFFAREFVEMGFPNEGPVKLQVIIHSAVPDAIPMEYRDHMIYHPRYRCGYTRFFFPSALPEVDSIIHLDSDMIVTGNIWKIWSLFEDFQGRELVGIARSNEANDTHYKKMYQHWFSDIPHPPPKGVNAGLLLMNLTQMREYNWEQKFLQVYQDYSEVFNLTGQRTVNILLSKDLDILKQISCQFNFCHRHCDKEFTCRDVLNNEDGIILLHGNGFKMERGQIFHPIFETYQNFDMKLINHQWDSSSEMMKTLKANLMAPIRHRYDMKVECSKCYGSLNYTLFTKFFTD